MGIFLEWKLGFLFGEFLLICLCLESLCFFSRLRDLGDYFSDYLGIEMLKIADYLYVGETQQQNGLDENAVQAFQGLVSSRWTTVDCFSTELTGLLDCIQQLKYLTVVRSDVVNDYELNYLQTFATLLKNANKQIKTQNQIGMAQSDDQIVRIGKYTSQFRGKDTLGSGGYGSVYVGYQIDNPKNKVAIKLINLKKSTLAEVMNEVECMLNNLSQGTLKILATNRIKFGVDQQDHYAIVTQKMDGSLRKLLQQKGKLTEEEAIEWGSKIIQCYKYLYKAKVIHRDLKPENVLYKNQKDQIMFKISDFGNSRYSKLSKSLTIGKGSILYMSPQQAKQGNYTNKTDVYAFGCMLFQFIVGSDKQPIEISKIFSNSAQLNKKEFQAFLGNLGVSKLMMQLIQGCLMYEQKDRLDWKDIFTHPIFSEKSVSQIPNEQTPQINQKLAYNIPEKVGNRFKIIKKISHDAFSLVYKAINTKNNLEVAVKFEPLDQKTPQLIFEAKIYNWLHNDSKSIGKGIPNIYYCATEGNYNVLVMDLMGPSLDILFNKSKRKFSLKTVLMIIDQMIAIVQYMHDQQFIHRNIRPDNFCVQLKQDSQKIFIIDLGFAKRYKKDGNHIPYREGKTLKGLPLYASINSHLGIQQACRDDMESIGYVAMHLLRGNLPWENLQSTKDIKQKIILTSVAELCKGYPDQFTQYFTQVRNLKFEQRPNYLQMRNMFKKLMQREGMKYDYLYDWLIADKGKK